MTIGGWIAFIFLGICILAIGGGIAFLMFEDDKHAIGAACIIVSMVLCALTYGGFTWFFQNTASGRRALVDQKSELANGLDRTITVYTADGAIIAQYAGNIDIEGNDGGYVLFDYEGKRYTYYNCFVESVANIG